MKANKTAAKQPKPISKVANTVMAMIHEYFALAKKHVNAAAPQAKTAGISIKPSKVCALMRSAMSSDPPAHQAVAANISSKLN